jgi:hypothetical protein
MGEKVKCSFEDCSNDGQLLLRAFTLASGQVRIMVCEACLPRLSKNQNVSMGTSTGEK